MRPNLSVSSFAKALAVVGSGALVAACGGADSPKEPVQGKEIASPGGAAVGGGTGAGANDPVPAEGQCGASKGCGANKLGGASGCGGSTCGGGGAGAGGGQPVTQSARIGVHGNDVR